MQGAKGAFHQASEPPEQTFASRPRATLTDSRKPPTAAAIAVEFVNFGKDLVVFRLSRRLRRRSREANAIQPFFDARFYCAEYPDVGRDTIDPLIHYLDHGWREGRNPSAVFSTLYYRDRYLRGLAEAVNPLLHYARLSPEERLRSPTLPGPEFIEIQAGLIAPYFDAPGYAVAAALDDDEDPIAHYLTRGWKQGLDPSEGFSGETYLHLHGHVRRLGVSPFYHYVSTYPLLHDGAELPGANADLGTDRLPRDLATASDVQVYETVRGEFDAEFYLSRQGDVRASGIDPVRHFLEFGVRENRDPNKHFSMHYYRGRYGDEIAAGVNPFFHYLAVGRARGYSPNPHGRGNWPPQVAPEPTAWQAVTPAADLEVAEVVLIMPVYKGYDDTLRAIHSVLASRPRTRFALLVINDAGPDARLTAALDDLAAQGLFAYRTNEANLGFVATCNRGLDIAAGKDVVLLNADIVVFGDWLDRLLWHAQQDAWVATVTPFSNNATICSYPVFNADNQNRLEIEPHEIDAYAALCNARSHSPVPTGVGFCFYMRRAVIDAVGSLDAETFGKGYGEENDFCLRASKAGFQNLLAHDVYVFHSGSVSFGSLIATKGEEIFNTVLRKHPDYRLRVENHIKVDPAQFARHRLDVFRFARRAGEGIALFVTHDWSGGIETHTEAMARRLRAEGMEVVYLRTAGPDTVKLGLPEDTGIDFAAGSLDPISLTKEAGLLAEFLDWLKPSLVHVHSLAELSWSSARDLMALIRRLPAYDCTLHDYSAACHRNHLVRPEGVYCRMPEPEVCRDCIRLDAKADGVPDPAERRAVFAEFLAGARRVYAPSDDIAGRLGPALGLPNLVIRPHEEDWPATELPRYVRGDRPLRIALLGAFGTHKGADVLYNLALDAQFRALPVSFTIVGYSNVKKTLHGVGVRETGRYASDAEAFAALKKLDPDLVFLPSIWPETYCYTLSMALAAGVPPVVFDLGAQAERLRALGEGHILDSRLIEDPQGLNDALLALPVDALWARRKPYRSAHYPRILEDYYGLPALVRETVPA